MTTILLAGALLAALPLAEPQAVAPPTYDEAVAVARRGEFREALDLFRRIVSAAPGDHDSRVWVARLLGFLGQSTAAEASYRGVLGENPMHVDAMVGLGGILANRGRYAEALAAYRERKFGDAAAAFERLAGEGDAPSGVLGSRAESLAGSSPGPGWEPVEVLTGK